MPAISNYKEVSKHQCVMNIIIIIYNISYVNDRNYSGNSLHSKDKKHAPLKQANVAFQHCMYLYALVDQKVLDGVNKRGARATSSVKVRVCLRVMTNLSSVKLGTYCISYQLFVYTGFVSAQTIIEKSSYS